MVSGHCTFSQDPCRAMGAAEAFAALRTKRTENERKPGRALKSD